MTARPKVLVVDDDRAVLSTFRRVFRRRYDITLAESPQEVVELVDRESFDIAFVDFAMPGCNGLELIAAIKGRCADLPCVLVSAHADADAVAGAIALSQADRLIRKPWDKVAIMAAVEEALAVDDP